LILSITVQPVLVRAVFVSNPAIQWQKEYGDSRTEYVSNLIQTSDGGYAFVDLGWQHSVVFQPATVYKIDSLGNVQWTKTINAFIGSKIIQTSDLGYEISGTFEDSGYLVGGSKTFVPLGYLGSIVKVDSHGNFQWIENYTSNLPILTVASSRIQTSDGGLISIGQFSIIKNDSIGNIQWEINTTYPNPLYGNMPSGFPLTSLIETSNGALAGLGIVNPDVSNQWMGNIYLVKTESFLPFHIPATLPPPLPSPIPSPTPLNNASLLGLGSEQIAIIAVVVLAVAVTSALLYRRHRK
jgi:hypothetical protein